MSVFSYACVSFPGDDDEENYIYIMPGEETVTSLYTEDGTQLRPINVKIDRNVLERNVKNGKLPYKHYHGKVKYINMSQADAMWVV